MFPRRSRGVSRGEAERHFLFPISYFGARRHVSAAQPSGISYFLSLISYLRGAAAVFPRSLRLHPIRHVRTDGQGGRGRRGWSVEDVDIFACGHDAEVVAGVSVLGEQ